MGTQYWQYRLKVTSWTLVVCAIFSLWTCVVGQESDLEEVREKSVVDRFVIVLEKNPRRGTALDKVYGFHVERGSLNGLIKTYRDKTDTAKGTDAASAWMIVGLLESLRGQDAAAVEAFAKSEQLDPNSYLASYYLGLSQVLIGQPDKAAEALERAIQRKPAQADQLDVFQALGRVYQRAQKSDKALEVWNRLEKQFPNDARVQEQIATTLLEEGEFASALPRFENLAKTTKDKYRQSLFQMEAAEIKVRLGKSADAIKEFESLLGQLNPDNWLYREVRRRIENVYLRTDDQAGLIGYYEAWMKKNPNDLSATTRIARLLAGLGRGPEAQQWLEKALKIAPTNKELRLTLIGQLMYEQKFVDVIAQYEQLDKHEPNNPDTLRDWGRVILKDTARDEGTRKKDAAAVWKRMTTSKPKDPLVASQVAELFRQVEMSDDALELYKKAISLAPEAAQYKEYLGEYFHSLKRKEEALATWRQIVDGKARTAPNMARLAEVLSSFGYLAEAIETNAEACKLDPKEINLQIKQADLLTQAEKHDDALKQLDVVKKLAANDEEREAWIGRELKELAAIDKLKDRVTDLKKELDERKVDASATEKNKAELADQWFWLARAYEFERQMKEAGQAISKASELAPQSIPILMASGRIQESQNNLLAAVEINTKLAAVDRRYRTEYLKKVAQLELQLGRREKGIQAGRDLLAAAPGNPELYEFFSQLCFQLGETEEGLQALRRSVRVNPTEPKGLLLLANALGDQFRTSEAIELYWRAFEKASNLDDRLGVVPKLAELYLQTNQLDRLLERLERQRREPNQQREMTICLAQAYQSAGDDGNARQELEKLLTEDTRDIQLLQQLVKLCESDGDFDMAVRYQQQMNKSSPGKEGIMRLAQLLSKSGEPEEAAALMTQLTADEKDPEQVLKSIDALLSQKQFDQALIIVQKLTRDQPKNWELLYREGAILAKSKPEEAAPRFAAIVAMKLKDDEQGVVAKAQAKKAAAAPRGQVTSQQRPLQQMPPSLQLRIQNVYTIRQAVDLDNRDYYNSGQQQQQPFWSPSDYGQARMAAFAWQMRFAQKDNKLDEFVKDRKDAAAVATDRRDLIDAYYLATLTSDQKETYRILKRLSFRPDADREIHQMYLYSLRGRGPAEGDVAEVPADAAVPDEVDDFDPDVDRNGNRIVLAPLDNQELEHVIAIARQLASLTEMDQYSWQMGTHLELIASELRRSGRKAEARQMFADAIEKAKEPMEIATLLQGVVQRGDYATAIRLLDRLAELAPTAATQTTTMGFNYAQYVVSPQFQSQLLAQLMANRAREKKLDEVLGLWGRYLKVVATREAAPPTPQAIAAKKQQRMSGQMAGNQYYTIWQTAGRQRGEQLDFPAPNDVYDQPSIQILRQMFALYREAEQPSQLTEAFAAAAKDPKTPEFQRKMWQFGLGYLHWWNEDKDQALAVLTEASGQIPNNNDIKFEMARLHEKRREFTEALALIDSITPGDQAALQQREVMALRLSVNGGDIERARVAADRLFGLRLDSSLQMALAQQMHQLGMHEQAEAVLARAGRQAGNRTEILGSLMEQYASSGKNDVAVQIAHQLLRRSRPSGASGQMAGSRVVRGRNTGDESGIRTQALQVLNRSGKLPEMIAKVESQLKNSPKSLRLLETILEYYVAAGNEKKIEEVNARLAEFKADDPKFKYQIAMKLLDAGKTKEANEHLKVVFEREPMLVMNQYWELQNKYQGQNKLEDLASLYESIDLKVFRQQPYVLSNAISSLSQQEQTKARALGLFKKAWAAVPDARGQLLGNMHDENFWKLPEIYDYAREGIIPTETMLQQNPFMVYNGMSYGQNGKITTLNTRVLDIATSQKKLDALAEEISAAMKKMPAWTGGKALLGMIDLRKGKVDQAKATFETMLPAMTKQTGNNQYYVIYALREIGQELMPHDSCADLAIKYFEGAVAGQNDNNEFQYTAGKPLMELLKKRGRRDEARQVLINGMKPNNQNRNNPGYEAYRRVASAVSIGKEFQDLGYPADAIKIYQKVLSNNEDITQSKQYGGDHYLNQLKTGLAQSLEQLKPESLAELLAPPVKPTAPPKPNPIVATPKLLRNQVVVEEPLEDFTSVDLILSLDSQDMSKSRMTSALVNLVAGIVKKPELLEKTSIALADVRSKRPDDLAAAILATTIAITSNDKSARQAAVDNLLAMIERLPLEAPPEKGGFTVKHRIAATQQAQLWLVARECWTNEELRPAGEKLAERALEAAKRLPDTGYALAILREWGQMALDSGDAKTAEQKWNEMLDLVIPKPGEKPKKSAGNATADAGGTLRTVATLTGLVTTTVARNTDVPLPPGTKGHAVTFPQFQKAAQIAKMAAENGLNELSLRAIEQSLHSGPPLEAMQDVQQGNNPFGGAAQVNDQSQSVIQVQQLLAAIEQVWRRKGVSDERVYLVLRGTMLPEPRPLEVFLYPQPLANSRVQAPQSIGALVVRAAVKANQTDDLKQRLQAKLGQPLGDLPARVALTQLALATGDVKTAAENLDLIAERIKLDSVVNSSDLACHVALPALEHPELMPRAIIIAERAADHYFKNLQNTRNSVEEPTRSFRFKLADVHFRNGNIEAGKKHLSAWVTQLASMWSNYGGDYPQYRRKSEYLSVSAAYARYGQRFDSLELLGRHADLPVTSDYGEQPVGLSGAVILYGLAQLEPAEQYSVLKSWSLPTTDRRSVRMMAGLLPGDSAPRVFDAVRDGTPRLASIPKMLSSADLLVRSAAATGKLDELRRELEPFAAENVENAQFLLLLTRLAQPDDATIATDLRAWIDARMAADAEADKNPNNNRRSRRPDATNAIISQAAVAHDATREAGLELCVYLFGRYMRYSDQLHIAYMRHLYNSTVVGAEQSAEIDRSPHIVDQKHWTGGAHTTANNENSGALPMWWLAHEGKLQHICGPGQGYLFFNYPLTGTFEFSCDIWFGSSADGSTGYGGLVFDTLNSCQVFPIGRREHVLSKPNALDVFGKNNRFSIQVTPSSIKNFCNGALTHEEAISGGTTVPWLFLHAERDWQTAFANARIEGQPVIPDQVSLSSSPTLLGWSGAFYGESLPVHFKQNADAANRPNPQQISSELDWQAVDGEIRGRQLAPASLLGASVMQSRLQYHRPLRNGEKLSYEFWYEPGPGAIHVHPALDRLAMILESDNVKLHWMTETNDDSSITKGLPAMNLIAAEAAQRKPGQLPLKSKDWNRVDVALRDDTIAISLNGTLIFERALEPENNRQFSFYHDKHMTSVRVRNVVLKGDWLKSLPREVLENLLTPARQHGPAERQRLARLFDDKFEAANLDVVLQATRGMLPADRYAALKSWVLPTEDHTNIRMYGDSAPADPLAISKTLIPPVSLREGKTLIQQPPAAEAAAKLADISSAGSKPVARRRRSGGEMIAPALDLVAVAKELGKLDELAEAVRSVPESSPFVKRSRLAMLTLIAISSGDSTAAGTLLKALTPPRDKGLSDELPVNERWPELIAACEATQVHELRVAAVDLLDVVLDSVNRKGLGLAWDVKVRSARQHAILNLEQNSKLPMASAVSPKGQWTQATLVKAINRGNGMVPRWRFQGTEASHLGGEGNDLIYFQSPLRGQFTVEGELSTFGWREARPMYAALWAGPQYTLEAADIGNLTLNWVGPKFPSKLESTGDWYRMKLEVTPDKAMYYANDQVIHEQALSDHADPWFAIHSYGQYAAALRSLRILGEPEIPAELQLSKRNDLQGWWSDMYGDPITGDNAMWKKSGDEISGTKLAGWNGRSRESLLQYHRPMLEDGEITYDFYYVPDQTHVHPALGRMVLLLDPDGVKVHWLTDAQFERGGLAQDNVSVEPENRRHSGQLPLNANNWNKLKLSLRGDTLSLALNGEAIYERPLEADNLRSFGLFHYTGDTDVRVMNVVYRGNWPRKLPSLDEQELSSKDQEFATFKEADVPEAWSCNFQGPRPGQLSLTSTAATNKYSSVEAGLQLVREPNSDAATDSAGLRWLDLSIEGDFEVTLGYRDFESQTKNDNHQVPRIEIILALGGTFGGPLHLQSVALTHRRRHDGNMHLSSIHGVRRNPPKEDWQSSDRQRVTTEGRIRIVRRGDMAYYMHSKLGSDDWEILDRRPVSTAAVKDLIIGLRSEELMASASATLTEFSIRAKRLQYRPTFAENELPARFSWNFQGPLPKQVQALSAEAPNRLEPVGDGIKIDRPEDPKQTRNPVGFQWQGSLHGDFEITLNYHDFESATNMTDWQIPRIEINVPIGGPDWTPKHTHTVASFHVRRADGSLRHAGGFTERKPDNQSAWKGWDLPTTNSSGRLRMVRQGKMLFTLAAPVGSDDFKVVFSSSASDAEVNSVSCMIRSEGEASRASVVFTEFSIRAQSFNGPVIASKDRTAPNAPAPSLSAPVAGPAPFGVRDLPAKVTWNFQGSRPRYFAEWGTKSKNQFVTEVDGIKILRRAKVDESEQAVGYLFDGGLDGDFEITLDYKDFASKPVLKDWQVPRVDLSIVVHSAINPDESTNSAGMAHRRNHDGGMRLLATQGDKVPDGKFVHRSTEANTDRVSGRLRLVRQDTAIFYQASPAGSDDWLTISRGMIDPGPVKSFSVGLRAEDLDASGEVVLTNVTIRANALLPK